MPNRSRPGPTHDPGPSHRNRSPDDVQGSAPGIGVDARGGGVIDPTKNVENLVRALEITFERLREADKELFSARFDGIKELVSTMSRHLVEYQNAMRDAETRRIDQLAQNRQDFQNTIRDMLAESVRTTSTLVSTQLVQIQATFDTRVSKLEAGAFTQAGKSSVSDPATAEALQRMASAIGNLGTTRDLQAGSSQGADRSADRSSTILSVIIAGSVAFIIFMTSIVGVTAFVLSR